MHEKIFLSISTLLIFLFTSCSKKHDACFNVSKPNPVVHETVTFDGSCSKHMKWAEFSVDGVAVGSSDKAIEYSFTSVGAHEVTLTAYSHMNGTVSSRTGCTGCHGAGKKSTITQTVTVTGPVIVASSNSPIPYDTTLFLTATSLIGADYHWTGPHGFISYQQNPIIPHVTGSVAGTFIVTATLGGVTGDPATVSVTLIPFTNPCTPSNNTGTFTGYPQANFTLISGNILSSYDRYEVYASSGSCELTIGFKGQEVPSDGIYTINTDGVSADLAQNEVYVKVNFSGALCYYYPGNGKVYVTVSSGKVSASFCNIPISCNSTIFNGSAKITVP